MDKLRKPFLLLALLLNIVIVSAELGSSGILSLFASGAEESQEGLLDAFSAGANFLPEDIRREVQESIDKAREEDDEDIAAELAKLTSDESPGIGIRYLVLVDGILLFTIGLIFAGVFVPEAVQGKVQGIVTVLFSILFLLAAIGMIIAAIAKLILMVSLLLSVPFGTLAYLAIYGSFPKGTAAAILGVLFTLKLGIGVGLILAHQRFLQNKGLVLMVITALLANIVVSFLHGLVPGILVSITDSIAALVVAILGVIWALFLLVGGVISVVKAMT